MKTSEAVVTAYNLCKSFQIGEAQVEVLKNVDLRIKESEFTSVSGPSGSGKTTLLNLVSGIYKPTSGKIVVFGNDLAAENESFLADFRCKNIGFVFQSYNLVSTLTVAENVAFPMEWSRKTEDHIRKRVSELLVMIGLQHRKEHFPSQLSGGEQQRVAFARALANDPPLLLVDEPTGNLDAKSSLKVAQILERLKNDGKTVVVVTHDDKIIQLADHKLHLEDGKLVSLNE